MIPTIHAKLSRFALGLFLGGSLGRAVGMAVDAGLWELSYDYVFPESYAARAGTRLGLFLGALYGAAATITCRPYATIGRSLRDAGIAGMFIVGGGLACGVTGWSLTKLGYGAHVGAGLALSPRHAFCATWVHGTAAAAWLVTVGLMIAVWRERLVAAGSAESLADVGSAVEISGGLAGESPADRV